MTKILLSFFLLGLISCASRLPEDEKKFIFESWKGHKVSELSTHSYFKNLPKNKIKHGTDPETWIYRDQARFQTEAYCQSLGGCMPLPTYNCESAFSVQNETILGFDQNGTCPDIRIIKPESK